MFSHTEKETFIIEFENIEEDFGPMRDEVTGNWRRLHNEELNYLYPSIQVTISS
jgi:hypothetical protein